MFRFWQAERCVASVSGARSCKRPCIPYTASSLYEKHSYKGVEKIEAIKVWDFNAKIQEPWAASSWH